MDVLHPPPFGYKDVYIRYTNLQRLNIGSGRMTELKFLILMGCGLAKSAATETTGTPAETE